MLLHHTPTGRTRYRLQHRHAAEADAAAAATTIIIAAAAAAAGLLLDPLTKSQASAKKLHEFSQPKGLPCALQPKRNRQLSLSFYASSYLACRSMEKAQATLEEIKQQVLTVPLMYYPVVDLMLLPQNPAADVHPLQV